MKARICIEQSLLDSMPASGSAWRVLVVLSFHNRVDREGINHGCWPGIKLLCKETGLSRMTVYRAIKELDEIGLVDLKHIGGKVHFYVSADKNNSIVAPDDVTHVIHDVPGKPPKDVSHMSKDVSHMSKDVSHMIHGCNTSDTPIGTRARPEVNIEVNIEETPQPAVEGPSLDEDGKRKKIRDLLPPEQQETYDKISKGTTKSIPRDVHEKAREEQLREGRD